MIGFFNVNKKEGITSSKAVMSIKKLLPKGTKIGHMGTLDPMASGVLPVAVGRATRLFDLMQNKQKEYVATFKFGVETNTLDSTGEIVRTTDVLPNEQQILETLKQFIGSIEQVPPSFSAKNIDGKRAYDMARKGVSVELKPCNVIIYNFELIECLGKNEYVFKIVCGSGTYIRSLCRDLAYSLGSLATMTKLVRTKTGCFCLENAVDYDKISVDNLIEVRDVVNLPAINLSFDYIKTLLDGKKVNINSKDGQYLVYSNDELQLVLNIKNGTSCEKIWLR